jgi:glycogen debranching enzyme
LLEGDRIAVPHGTLHIFRSKFLWRAACYERLRLRNFGTSPVEFRFSLHFRSDFADIFEVRGTHRDRHGRHLGATVAKNEVVLAYEGLDGVARRTRLAFNPAPNAMLGTEAFYRVALPPHAEAFFELVVTCEEDGNAQAWQADKVCPEPAALAANYEAAHTCLSEELKAARCHAGTIHTSDTQFNDWLNRAVADLAMMTTQMRTGPYPYAGVPWFSTPFGRDGLVTALECLWLEPTLARGVLAFLADTQAREVDPAQDAEPGKILHEARGGEMAALGEVPFRRYYGSVDATPLFVWLAGAYYHRTGHRSFVESLWPNIERALHWIDTYGDRDRDGFVEYLRTSPNGLVQQGWKDSHDSVFHADGTLAQGPIALCEVQGYVYAARLAAADLSEARGYPARAADLRRQAASLRERFEQAFWCDDLGMYALALDGDKRPCRVRTSNPGHCLLTGIADANAGRRCGAALLGDAFFTGWGIRTLARGEARYNPMSYHDGSVWPHDNALAAAGLARYGMRAQALRILNALFDVSKSVDLYRLPELFCGFSRRPGEGPTRYPVACSPQAWSAAAVFLVLEACLGMSIQAQPPMIRFTAPLLPDYLSEIEVKSLRVGTAHVDFRLRRKDGAISLDVLRRDGDVEIHLD